MQLKNGVLKNPIGVSLRIRGGGIFMTKLCVHVDINLILFCATCIEKIKKPCSTILNRKGASYRGSDCPDPIIGDNGEF